MGHKACARPRGYYLISEFCFRQQSNKLVNYLQTKLKERKYSVRSDLTGLYIFMNIQKAKEQIKKAVTAYFTKNELGKYVIPLERQRPVFLMGPPGIGKTAIMEQIASELDVPLVSYSMTHHTRQSALGLPFISHKVYDGMEYDISEYTMSEIIASVYETMEATGRKEGILFLDEINCVSETLAPVMLQFLQYKVFGRHRVPDGWIVVTAGNPPEYNNSVREFDIVTWDRLKRIDVEPDYAIWKEYAVNAGIHAAVTSYLDIKKDNFYKVETSVRGKRFITARGWEDLSQMITLFEYNNLEVDIDLIGQYIQNDEIKSDFASYYSLFMKYKSFYNINEILDGNADAAAKKRAAEAKFDERLSLISLIYESLSQSAAEVSEAEGITREYMEALKLFRASCAEEGCDPQKSLRSISDAVTEDLNRRREAGSLSSSYEMKKLRLVSLLSELELTIGGISDGSEAFAAAKASFDGYVADFKKKAAETKRRLSAAFAFLEEVFGEGHEIMVFMTELTLNKSAVDFIGKYGCDEYFRYNKNMLFHERKNEILSEISLLEL